MNRSNILLIVGSYSCTIDGIQSRVDANTDIDVIGEFRSIQRLSNRGESLLLGKTKKLILFDDDVKVEAETAWCGSSAYDLMNLVLADGRTDFNRIRGNLKFLNSTKFLTVHPSNDVLYALKMSHRYLKNSPFFKKTMDDIHIMRQAGCRIPESYLNWYKKREDETYDYSHPKLTVSKKNFFVESESFYKYDHDDLHLAVKHFEKPAYEFFKKPNEEVLCDKNLFNSSPKEIKLAAVLEECYVLSLERFLIPNNFKTDPFKGFEIALEKVCTSITSGFFREWAWENYYEIYSMYDGSYVSRFNDALNMNKIKPFRG